MIYYYFKVFMNANTMASPFNFKCFLDEQKNENKEKTKTKTPFLKTKLARCTG